MRKIVSAGGVVFNSNGEVLLIMSGSLRDESRKHWKFPKGHIEEGEASDKAALREVEEETGVVAKISKKIGDSKYNYTYKEEKIFKIVIMYLMDYQSGELNPQLEEIDEARWFTPVEAISTLSFVQDKVLLEKALEIKSLS